MKRLIVMTFALLVSCSSSPKTGILASKCQQTAVHLSDMEAFGFKAVPGKVVVLRIFGTWCPFCKTDLNKMAAEFQNKSWSTDNVNILLLGYKNHSESRATIDAFVKEKLPSLGISREAVQVLYIDKSYAELKDLKSAAGEPLFTGWTGIPYSLVFGKDGRLAFRGQFTMDDVYEQHHYRFITELQKETCKM